MTQSGPIRALIASGVNGSSVVVAHDSAWLAADIENISDGAEDLGLPGAPGTGLWLWEGTAKLVSGPDSDGVFEPPESEYTGTIRDVLPVELPALLAMRPAEDERDCGRCCQCGQPATHDYLDREDLPSCGRPRCELRMQAAADYHDEAGDR